MEVTTALQEGRSARPRPVRRTDAALLSVADGVFFVLGAVAAGWLAVLTVQRFVLGGLQDWWLLVGLWALLAYLLLPRVHTLLARVYVPDYFIGRTRTYEGLLGDPVNVAVLGTAEQVHAAMTRAGWQLADELGFRSGLRIVTSTLGRRTYPTAPVSPLFLFGRLQDLTYQQEVEGNPARRHHVRFWRTPPGWYLPGGARVDWLAAGTYDRGVGLSAFTLQVTHKISHDTDAERDHVVATVLAGHEEAQVEVIRRFSSGYHSRNGGGDAIVTDGDLPVLDVTRVRAHRLPAHGGAHHDAHGPLSAQARALLARVQDTGASNRVKRPMTLYLGYGLVLLRALVAAGTLLAALLPPALPAALPAWAAGAASWVSLPPLPTGGARLLLGAAVVAVLAYAVLGQRAFWGHPLARLVLLVVSVAAIGVALAAGAPGSAGPGNELWAMNLALDVGVLITLSSGDVRDFHLRLTALRRAQRGAAHDGPHRVTRRQEHHR